MVEWIKIYYRINDLKITESTVNIYGTIQQGIRGGLASVIGDCHVKCMNKQIYS